MAHEAPANDDISPNESLAEVFMRVLRLSPEAAAREAAELNKRIREMDESGESTLS